MTNMFSDVQQKEIPKSFKDCYANDQITDNLWQWAKNLETIGRIFAIVSGIVVLFFSLILIVPTSGASLIGILVAPIIAFLEYVSFYVIALLVGSLASIVLNTRITANINLFKYAQENGINDNVDDKINNAIINA